jgi:hypothetical protein
VQNFGQKSVDTSSTVPVCSLRVKFRVKVRNMDMDMDRVRVRVNTSSTVPFCSLSLVLQPRTSQTALGQQVSAAVHQVGKVHRAFSV